MERKGRVEKEKEHSNRAAAAENAAVEETV